MADYQKFIVDINQYLKIDLSLYKEAQMKRRLTTLRNKRGYRDFQSYFEALKKDEELREEFIDRITINVSEFFRNPKRWEVLKEKVIPFILEKKGSKSIQIWSAACSTGEEPYSLAIIFSEYFRHVNVSIIATDIDEKALQVAKKGVYQPQSLKELPSELKQKYFTFKNNKYYIDDKLKSTITFKKHDLLKDVYPSNVDLIVCRNVLIYFTDEAKEEIYTNFSKALAKNGILFVGSTEQIFSPDKYNLTLFDTFFYEKT